MIRKKTNYRKFDIVIVDFGEEKFGSEQGGIRPALVIQNDIGNLYSPTTIVIPISTKIKNSSQPTHCILKRGIGNLKEDSILLGEQIRAISKKRILKIIGEVTELAERTNIKNAYLANFADVNWGDIFCT